MNNTLIPLYKYLEADSAKKVLVEGRLQWSSPVKFNDELDVVRRIGIEKRAGELNMLIAKELARLIRDGKCPPTTKDPRVKFMLLKMSMLPVKVRNEIAEEVANVGADEAHDGQIQALKILSDKWEEMVGQMRILSLSEKNDVKPLWAHYAGKGTGIVLEFQGSKQLDSVFLAAKKVNYTDSIPSILSLEDWCQCVLGTSEKTYDDMFKEIQYIKTLDWEYEKEWRVVTYDFSSTDRLTSFIPFFNEDLTGVYLGYKCDNTMIDEVIRESAKYKNARIFASKFNDFQRSVVFERLK